MARTKHNTTRQGTHRQRIFRYKQSIVEANKRMLRLEADAKLRALLPPAPAEFEVKEAVSE